MNYRLTRRAKVGLANIHRFLAARSPAAAAKLLTDMQSACRTLSNTPLMGWPNPEAGARMRSYTINTYYIIIYRPMHYGVEISRIYDGRRDPHEMMRR